MHDSLICYTVRVKNVEKAIKKYLTERSWDRLRPGDVAKSISIESAELLELFQWSNPTLEEVKNNPEKIKEIQKELADVLIYALDMAVLLEVDTEAIIKEKLAYAEKKYPAELMKKIRKNEPGTEDTYLQIKKKYRKEGLS